MSIKITIRYKGGLPPHPPGLKFLQFYVNPIGLGISKIILELFLQIKIIRLEGACFLFLGS